MLCPAGSAEAGARRITVGCTVAQKMAVGSIEVLIASGASKMVWRCSKR